MKAWFGGHTVLSILHTFTLLLVPCSAKLVNVTVDDTSPDPETGNVFTYAGPWNQGNGCTTCTAQPPATLAFDETWHDATYDVSISDPPLNQVTTASFSFTGSAFYVFGIQTQANTFPDTADLSFFIDGELAGTYTYTPPGDPDEYTPNVLLWSTTSIAPGQHTFTLQNGQPQSSTVSLVLFDYAIYTRDDVESSSLSEPPATSAVESSPTSSSSTNPPSPSPTSTSISAESMFTPITPESSSTTTSSNAVNSISSISSSSTNTTKPSSTVSLIGSTPSAAQTTSMSPSETVAPRTPCTASGVGACTSTATTSATPLKPTPSLQTANDAPSRASSTHTRTIVIACVVTATVLAALATLALLLYNRRRRRSQAHKHESTEQLIAERVPSSIISSAPDRERSSISVSNRATLAETVPALNDTDEYRRPLPTPSLFRSLSLSKDEPPPAYGSS